MTTILDDHARTAGRVRRMTWTAIATLFVATAASCTPAETAEATPEETEEPVFQYATVTGADLAMTVQSEGRPLADVLVHIRRVGTDGASGTLIATARTDESGHLGALLSIESELDEIELVVIKPGYLGPMNEETRRQLGAFAPAARFRVAVEDLADVQLDLEKAQ
ncbi:MAG: hypothetical protein HOW73_02165 [Polyangiaceae bacterium]|nr:hypothetical protein [Polyangiaceae bacterium]